MEWFIDPQHFDNEDPTRGKRQYVSCPLLYSGADDKFWLEAVWSDVFPSIGAIHREYTQD